MVHAHAALPRIPLDPKRIAATSAVIALHVGVLMLLMMPAQVSRPEAPDSTFTPPDPRRIIVPTVLPPERLEKPKPIAQVVPAQKPVAIEQPQVESVDQTVGALDTQAVDVAPDSGDVQIEPAGTGFLQLTALLAPPPVYPRMAIQRHLTGTVTLRIHVDANGLPTEVMVENTSGHAMLDEAAMKVVQKRWRFVPATRNGQPVEGWALVPVVFVLQ
jgi:protein TonB